MSARISLTTIACAAGVSPASVSMPLTGPSDYRRRSGSAFRREPARVRGPIRPRGSSLSQSRRHRRSALHAEDSSDVIGSTRNAKVDRATTRRGSTPHERIHAEAPCAPSCTALFRSKQAGRRSGRGGSNRLPRRASHLHHRWTRSSRDTTGLVDGRWTRLFVSSSRLASGVLGDQTHGVSDADHAVREDICPQSAAVDELA